MTAYTYAIIPVRVLSSAPRPAEIAPPGSYERRKIEFERLRVVQYSSPPFLCEIDMDIDTLHTAAMEVFN
jgi:hypothetical protein